MNTARKKTYVVSDIHGYCDEFFSCLERIYAHAQTWRIRIVFLGDYIDKGPDALYLLKFLEGPVLFEEKVLLRGNHDWWLERWIAGAEVELRPERLKTLGDLGFDLETRQTSFSFVPEFFKNLQYTFEDEIGNKYVHAYYSPKIAALENPKKKSLLVYGPVNSPNFTQNENGVMTPDRTDWYTGYDGRHGHVYFGHYNLGQYNDGNPTFFKHATCLDCCVQVTGQIRAFCVNTGEVV